METGADAGTLDLTAEEVQILFKIQSETARKNVDNVSRTSAYLDFYLQHPDIKWAFLASMVSRNGGYSMCDLEGEWYPKVLKPSIRNRLFLTYERANWTIFHDAYPQLLLYEYSTQKKRKMFHLLPYLKVSSFMLREWEQYWIHRDQKQLMTALIVNEQNVIHRTVVEHHVYQKQVFDTFMFFFQDRLHFSAVLLPTINGKLFGASVNGFKNVHKRIDLGKRLADILFNPKLYPSFLEFALLTEHTGSRNDYEQYFREKTYRDTPYLRCIYPVVRHHETAREDWYLKQGLQKSWMEKKVCHKHPIDLTKWFVGKQQQFKTLVLLKQLMK
ncbi:DUF2515 domain-containing protein [Mesobacillus foraminis]|uniref:Uncharacterized protein DUF2515 n=1 Tax=Mesobacillus foraminis TaxID=279826 RepID=A0A4R2B8P1_9BACI|nr:DUF2515 domain-containing protein [Mesobacillus foraminis]TCN23081.1 uncharacterized protein DUF2515 [Mesobacillus foraminis]